MLLYGMLLTSLVSIFSLFILNINKEMIKKIALATSLLNLVISLFLFIIFDFSNINFQFVQEITEIKGLSIYIGIDGISIYFILLTTFIMPLVILSNWYSITSNVKTYMILILLLEVLLLFVFLVLDIFLFYIFFESTLIPLFLLIGMYGSFNKVRASFYLFLYTLFGSLFLLLSILYILTLVGVSDFDQLFKTNLNYFTQLILFYGIFIAFAVKTPVIFLNNWLLKAHVESPLGGSIILAAIVLKLSLYECLD